MSICSWQSHFSWQRLFSDQTVEAPQCFNRAFSVCQGLVSVSRRVTWRIAFHAVSKCSQEDVALQLWEEGCFSQKERKLACALARWRALAPPRAPLLTKELQSKRWNAAWSLLVEPGKRKMNLALSLLTKMQRKGYEAPAFSYNVLMNLTGESDAHQSLRLLQSMQDNGPKPSVVSYNTVMKSFAREGNLATQNFLRKWSLWVCLLTKQRMPHFFLFTSIAGPTKKS